MISGQWLVDSGQKVETTKLRFNNRGKVLVNLFQKVMLAFGKCFDSFTFFSEYHWAKGDRDHYFPTAGK